MQNLQGLTPEQAKAQDKFQDQLRKLIFLNQKLPGHSLHKYSKFINSLVSLIWRLKIKLQSKLQTLYRPYI